MWIAMRSGGMRAIAALAPRREIRSDVLGELTLRILFRSRLPEPQADAAAAYHHLLAWRTFLETLSPTLSETVCHARSMSLPLIQAIFLTTFF